MKSLNNIIRIKILPARILKTPFVEMKQDCYLHWPYHLEKFIVCFFMYLGPLCTQKSWTNSNNQNIRISVCKHGGTVGNFVFS